ncbi:MAG TPA: Crp/Fnr family transcriptional regulator [Egibacteraceae bacterium]|nr:Crp/Fnr family transcriptional regulator [Egibacteraceae bacterium]
MVDAGTPEGRDRLRSVPLFSQLGQAALDRVLATASEHEVGAGYVLVQPDQPGAGLFIIEEGTVVVERPGRPIELGKGEFFGELALLSPEAVHSVRVRAAGPVRFLALARNDFAELIESEPGLALSMLRWLAHRLWETARS